MPPRTNNRPLRRKPARISQASAWARYEAIKLELTATTHTAAAYEAACRLAAKLAGV